MFGDVDFETREVTFAPGDAVLVFTDGLTEAEDGDGQLFGEERLLQVLREPLNSARALTDRVARTLDRFVGATAQSDDLTLLVVHRLTEAAPPA